MTFTNQENRTSAVGSGAIGQVIPYTFPISATSDLAVYKLVTVTGVQTLLDETTNYTVSINGNLGGNVTTVTVIEATEQIHIVRNTPFNQQLDLETGGDFNAENIEDALDKNAKLSSENKDKLTYKAITLPETDAPGLTTILPSSVDRASKNLTFDASGNVTASTSVEEGSVSFTTFGTNMAEAANALAAKAVINLDHAIDVRDYDATGDGTTDDTVAIQAAFTAAGTSGMIFFPDGEYKVTDAGGLPITYDPRVMVSGESRNGVIITNTSTSEYAFQYHSAIGDAYTSFTNPGGFEHMQINGKLGIKFNQTLAEIGGIWSGDWNEQDNTLGWKIHDISFKGDYSCQADANRDTNTEPASVADYTTYGIGLCIVRPFLTDISQCAFRGHGVGLFMEGADLTHINNNRFITNSCHIYATNGTDSTFGFNSIVNHNDILICYRRRHVWLEGQDGRLGGWSICNNFFESGGPQAENLYVNAGQMHKIYANFFSGSGIDPGATPLISFVGAGYSHLVYGNGYGVGTYNPGINVDWLTGTRSGRKWIYFYGNAKEFPAPNNPRGIQGAQESNNPFMFDCVNNQTKFEAGTAHADVLCFAEFDGFYHLDVSTGTVDMFFRDGRVDRLSEFVLHIKGVITGGADGDDNQLLAVYHDAVEDYNNANFLTNLTDDDIIDVRLAIISGAGVKRVFLNTGYLAISSIEIISGIEGNKVYYENNDVAYENNEVRLIETGLLT